MTTKPPISDPWRIYSREPGTPQNKKSPPAEVHPLDADLLPDVEYVLRNPNSIGDILIKGANEPVGAVKLLLDAIATLPVLVEELRVHGVNLIEFPNAETGGKGVQIARPRGFFLKSSSHLLTIPNAQNVPEGLSNLVKCLMRSAARPKLEKAGVIPLLK